MEMTAYYYIGSAVSKWLSGFPLNNVFALRPSFKVFHDAPQHFCEVRFHNCHPFAFLLFIFPSRVPATFSTASNHNNHNQQQQQQLNSQ